MGGTLSSNFEQINNDFIIECWKVSSATDKNTKQKVSLWQLDQQLLQEKYPSEAEKDEYINRYIKSIQNVKKLRHPNVLKIIQVQDNKQNFEFITEPVAFCLKSNVSKLDKTDASYIMLQLLEALYFIHDIAKSVHLNVNCDTILLNDQMTVKLFGFNWFTNLSDTQTVPAFEKYETTPNFPNIKYSAPELVSKKELTTKADIFSAGVVFYELLTGKQIIECEKPEDYNTEVSPISKVTGMTSDVYSLLQKMMNIKPELRPPAKDLLRDEMFKTQQIESLRFMDTIIVETPQDRFNFYKKLGKQIDKYSTFVKKSKIIPLLVNECKENIKFSPILLGIIFDASKNLTIDEFTDDVFIHLTHLLKVQKPPEILFAFIHKIEFLLANVNEANRQAHVYPILSSALKSDKEMHIKEVLKKIPIIIKDLNEPCIQKILLPNLVRLCEKSDNIEYISKSLQCIKACAQRVDQDQFLKYIIPRLYEVWENNQEPYLIPFYTELLLSLKGSEQSEVAYAVPLAAEIISFIHCDPYYQKQLTSWMLATITKFKTTNKLDEVQEPMKQKEQININDITALFDPLAEELKISPSQEIFDFTKVETK